MTAPVRKGTHDAGRVDYTTARTSPVNHTWAGTSTVTAGLAIY